jgi:hypothetical protein
MQNSPFELEPSTGFAFLGIPKDSRIGDGVGRNSSSVAFTVDGLEIRLNIPRRPLLDGELGGLGDENGTSPAL